jgi:enoyl-CoA hydratase/carnithine racemase
VPSLSRDGDVFVLDLGDGENRFNPAWVGAVNAALDEVEATPAPRALVTKAEGKIWSNGLDLEWMGQNPTEINPLLAEVHGLFARVLELGVPNVAALQGHTFAAGAMLALAHDKRVMRSDRGYFCLPEVDINIPFTPGMSALILAKLPINAAHEAMTTGRRFGGDNAARIGIVDEASELDQLVERAIQLVAPLAKNDPGTLNKIKARMYEPTLATLRDVAANSLSVPGQ